MDTWKDSRAKVAAAKFPLKSRDRAVKILVQARRRFRAYRNHNAFNAGPLPGSSTFKLRPKKRGPKDKKEIRMYLISQIHFAWLAGFKDYPTISNKGCPKSPFMKFAESILISEGVFKVIDNLEAFRSYRKKELLASGFRLSRGRVI